MKILVTGGCGFLGTNVCLEARARGHEVIAFDNLVRPLVEENIPVLEKAGVAVVRGDVRNRIDLDKLPDIPETIIHLAGPNGIAYGQESPAYDFEINVLGTINILEYARNNWNIPVIFASTNKVYTNVDRNSISGVIPENASIDQGMHTFYGTSKTAADLYCQEYFHAYGLSTVVNRMSSIYGYYQKPNEQQGWVSWLVERIKGRKNINIFGTGKQVRDILFGTDCAKLYLDEVENMDKVEGQVFNIGGGLGNYVSLLEVVGEIEKQTGNKAKITFVPGIHENQNIYISDITRITKTLGWKPTISAKKGIKLLCEL